MNLTPEEIKTAMTSGSAKERARACLATGKAGVPLSDGQQILRMGLADRVGVVRAMAVLSCEMLKIKDLTGTLASLIDDDDLRVRSSLCSALRSLYGKQAVPSLSSQRPRNLRGSRTSR